VFHLLIVVCDQLRNLQTLNQVVIIEGIALEGQDQLVLQVLKHLLALQGILGGDQETQQPFQIGRQVSIREAVSDQLMEVSYPHQ